MNICDKPQMEKKQLITVLGQLLKVKGFKKIGKGIWHKELGEDFVLKFRVQSDRFEKGEYILRVGVEVVVPGIKLKYPLYECIDGILVQFFQPKMFNKYMKTPIYFLSNGLIRKN